MLPDEIKDLILSFCEGHVRADLRIKNVGVPLKPTNMIVELVEKMLLKECCLSGCDGLSLYFVNKQDTSNLVGYISKMITEDKILYTWVKIEQT
jgi:hypothetical protein